MRDEREEGGGELMRVLLGDYGDAGFGGGVYDGQDDEEDV